VIGKLSPKLEIQHSKSALLALQRAEPELSLFSLELGSELGKVEKSFSP